MKVLASALLGCLCLASSALADTTYQVTNVSFTNGSVANGTFTFDGVNGFSNINISLTAGNNPVFGPTTFQFDRVPGSSNQQDMFFSNQNGDQTGALFIHLQFLPDLNSPVPALSSNSDIGDCGNSNCGTGNVAYFYTGGSGSIASTPEPATFLVVPLGLAAMALRKKFRKA